MHIFGTLSWKPFCGLLYMGAHWRHLANTTAPFMCGGDAAVCQITLTICYSSCVSYRIIQVCVIHLHKQSLFTLLQLLKLIAKLCDPTRRRGLRLWCTSVHLHGYTHIKYTSCNYKLNSCCRENAWPSVVCRSSLHVLKFTYFLKLVQGQVTIIFVVSVRLSVCLFVCVFMPSFSQPSSNRFGSN